MTFSSILSMIFFNSLLIIFVYFFVSTNRFLYRLKFSILLLVIGLIIVRFLLPFELPIMKTISIKYFWPYFFIFLNDLQFLIFDHKINLLSVLILLWVLGAALSAHREIHSYLKVRQFVRSCLPVKNEILTTLIYNISLKYKKKIHFQLVQTDEYMNPTIFGIRNPYIVIPLSKFEHLEWRYILEHEIAHFYNNDLYYKLICTAIRIIYWWNPFVYLLSDRLHHLLELNIDRKVTSALSSREKTEYLDCLLQVAKACHTQRKGSLLFTFSFQKQSFIRQRFQLILHNENTPQKGNLISQLLWIGSFILIMGCSYLFIFEPYGIRSKDQKISSELSAENSYYIVNPAGTYDLYHNNTYFGTVKYIFDTSIKVFTREELP